MANRSLRFQLRRRSVNGGPLPSDALYGEPFINDFNGVLRFSGTTGGDFEESGETGIFEVGSKLFNSKITNRLSVNDNFIVSGDTGIISTYAGISGVGLDGKFMSGTTSGFVLADIADIQGQTKTFVQEGSNIVTGGTVDEPIVSVVDSPSFDNLDASGTTTLGVVNAGLVASQEIVSNDATLISLSAGTINSGSTNLYDIFLTSGDLSGTSVSAGYNIDVAVNGNDYEVSLSDDVSTNSISATTITGGTLYSEGDAFVNGSLDVFGAFTNVNYLTAENLEVEFASEFNGEVRVNNNLIVTGDTTLEEVDATTFLSAGTDLYSIFSTESGSETLVQEGSNIVTGGTPNEPIVSVVDSPNFDDITVSGTGEFAFITSGGTDLGNIFATPLDATIVIGGSNIEVSKNNNEYTVSLSGDVTNNSINTNTLNTDILQVGNPGDTGTTTTIFGDLLVIGESISGFTSDLYIEDNRIELNFNPTASTISTSLGSGFSIQDGSGVPGSDVYFDVRGTGIGVANRSFATNLEDLRIRETGTFASPNG